MKRTTFVILVILVASSFINATSSAYSRNSSQVSVISAPKSANLDQYREDASVWINSEGYVWSEYNIEGPTIGLSGLDISQFQNNFPAGFNAFAWADWDFRSQGPGDNGDNVWVSLEFYTSDFTTAKSYSDWVMDFVNAWGVNDYNFASTNTWDEWQGDHYESITEVCYNAHIAWPYAVSQYDASLPRDQGGLAESLNVSEANSLRMHWWREDQNIGMNLGFGWDSQVDKLSGTFSYSIRDFIPVGTLKKLSSSGAESNLRFNLPNVDSISYEPAAYVYIDDRSSGRNPWDMDDYYQVSLNLNDGLPSVTDFTIDFDYTFQPWDSRSLQEAALTVNPYGYALNQVYVAHENASLYNWSDYFAGNDALSKLKISYFHNELPWDPGYNIHMTLDFTNFSAGVPMDEPIPDIPKEDYLNDMESFANWVNNTRNWNLIENWTSDDQQDVFEFWDKDIKYPTRRYYIRFEVPFVWEELYNTSWIYQHSDLLQVCDSSVLNVSQILQERYEYHPDFGGYYTHSMLFNDDPLNAGEQSPVKLIAEGGDNHHTLGIANALLGGGSFIHSPDFYSTLLDIEVPAYSGDFYNKISIPEKQNGYGFDTGFWFNDHNGNPYMEAQLRLYTQSPYYDQDSSQIPVDDLEVSFVYDIHADTEDIFNPRGEFGWWNHTTAAPEWDLRNSPAISSPPDERFIVKAEDTWGDDWRNYQVWNGTDMESRFPVSGIDHVDLDFFFNQVHIPDEDFHWGPFTTTHHDSADYWDNYWYQDIDVTQFPDGFIDVEARIEDGAGNVGFTMWTFEVDNYNEFTLPPTIDLFPPTPANNSHLSGTVPITMNLTDDIDIFAATITIGEGPMLGSAYVFNETGTPGIYSFDYNTMIEAENSGKWITITAWDMDGHQTDYYLHYIIDNLAAGNPPDVTIISPNEGDILQDVVTFQVAANDDNGISSIQGQIDDRVPTDMNFNSGTGYYEFEYNVSTLINGTHTFSAIVIDVDDPSEGTGQHTVNQTISFFADTDITEAENTLGPEVRNVYPLNVTTADDILNGTINFNLEVKDDVGISAVNIKISSVSGYGVTNIPGSVDDVDMNNILIVGGYPQGMNLVGTSDGWSKYDNSFDSTKVSDGIYLVEITIGDLDTKQHTTDVKILILVLNSQSGNPFADIPGFSIEFFIGAMFASSAFIIWKLRKRFYK